MKDKLFATRLKTLMARKSMTTKELAALMQCSNPTISAWRTGTIPYSKIVQKKLADVLEVNVETLIFGENTNIQLEISENPVFANEVNRNSKSCKKKNLRKEIEMYFSELLSEAEKSPLALEHLFVELKLRFPKNFYSNLH